MLNVQNDSSSDISAKVIFAYNLNNFFLLHESVLIYELRSFNLYTTL